MPLVLDVTRKSSTVLRVFTEFKGTFFDRSLTGVVEVCSAFCPSRSNRISRWESQRRSLLDNLGVAQSFESKIDIDDNQTAHVETDSWVSGLLWNAARPAVQCFRSILVVQCIQRTPRTSESNLRFVRAPEKIPAPI